MNKLILSLMLIFTGSVFAQDQIQFDVNLNISVCTLTKTYSIVQCYPLKSQFRETLTAILVHTDCGAGCKYNDTAEITKSYTLIRPDNHVAVPVTINVAVTRSSGIFDPTLTDYFVEAGLNLEGGTRDDLRTSIVDVNDLSAINDVPVEGRESVTPLPDGNILVLRPRYGVTNLKILNP